MNNQLFLRASVRNRSEIKRALAAIDMPSRQLLIRISQTREADSDAQGLSASGQIVLGNSNRGHVDARVWDTRSQRRDSGGQMVRALEGSPAFIQIGHSLPLPMRQLLIGPTGAIINETVVYQDIGQGFYAVPRLNGNRVTLEINQQADTPAQFGRGSVNTQRLSTTVSGRLGEWMELGGAGQQSGGRQGGAWNSSTREVNEQRSIWLKVEEVD
jgi:type II secretory pathway component GspD/PulD (secretin)